MNGHAPLIATLAVGLGLALVFGLAATRLRLPPLVGYLVAGVLIGPGTPGFVADVALARELAEVGVILLMFGVGLHFSIADLWAVRRISVPGAVAQIVAATALGTALAVHWGWSVGAGIVFGLSLSVASTVVLLRALEQHGTLDSMNGRIAVGWLVVEDVATVFALVLLPALAPALGGSGASPSTGVGTALAVTLAQVGLFVFLMMAVGRRLMPWLLWRVAGTGSRELFTLSVVAAGVGIAYAASTLFGVSFALGAFFAGSVMRESALSHRAAEESLPLRDAFSVLFFVSVGMLLDPSVLLEEPGRVLAVTGVIIVGKSLAAFGIVMAFGYPLNTALTVAASLAQIGEFSFILAALGMSLGLLPSEGQQLILAGAIVSIALNPLVFRGIEPLQRLLMERSSAARRHAMRDDPLAGLPADVSVERLTAHAVVTGYGRVGKPVVDALRDAGETVVVIEENRELVDQMRRDGQLAVAGDAAEPEALIQGHVARARFLIIATPDATRSRRMVDIARRLNPRIHVVARAHSEFEAAHLRADGADRVFIGEVELAGAMVAHVTGTVGSIRPS